MANPLTAPSGMGAARGLGLDALAIVLFGLAGGENARGEDGDIATRLAAWLPLRGEVGTNSSAAGGLDDRTTISYDAAPAILSRCSRNPRAASWAKIGSRSPYGASAFVGNGESVGTGRNETLIPHCLIAD